MFLTRSLIACGLLFCIVLRSEAQQHNHFIIIGAFEQEQNARKALIRAEENNLPARYAYHPDKKTYYVYVRLVSDLSLARETVRSVRKEGFPSAWIYTGDLLNTKTLAKIEPFTGSTNLSDNTVAAENHALQQDVIEATPVSESGPVQPETVAEKPVVEAVKPEGNPFLFRLVDINGQSINGVIRLQESDRANQFNPFKSNEIVYVTAPKNRGGRWFVVCEVVGYRPYRIQFSYKDAMKVMETGANGEHILDLEMTPVKRGDYIELETVHFLTNSNIFTPESRQSLDELVAMMKSNPEYRIRIHGHTNGDNSRDIVCALDNQDLFSSDGENKKYTASAKELSTHRAQSAKRYLMENGIEEKRIQIKGEGGKQILFEGTMAALNDRLEVEVLKH